VIHIERWKQNYAAHEPVSRPCRKEPWWIVEDMPIKSYIANTSSIQLNEHTAGSMRIT
jgi:hypothetical protein